MTVCSKCLCLSAVLSIVLLVAVAIANAAGRPVSSFEWAGAPPATELEPLIQSAWMTDPPSDEAWYRIRYRTGLEGSVIDLGDEGGGPAKSAIVRDLTVGRARRGRDETGRRFTYWPVAVTIRTRYRWNEPKPSKYQPGLVLTIRDCDVECYAIFLDGAWTVTFEAPIDETWAHKFW